MKNKSTKIALLIASCVFAVALITPFIVYSVMVIKPKPCSHSWGTWITNQSGHYRSCRICQQTSTLEQHTFIDTFEKDILPQQSNDGVDYKECSVCGYKEGKTLSFYSYFLSLLNGEQMNNVTIEQTEYTYNDNSNVPINSATTKYQLITENAMLIQTNSTTTYHAKKDNIWYDIRYYLDDQWCGVVETESAALSHNFYNSLGNEYEEYYTSFHINSTLNKGYYATNVNINGDSCEYVKIYIENHKITKIEQKIDSGSQYKIIETKFINYGTTSVTSPEFQLRPNHI